MPIQKPSDSSAPVFFPKENYKISKYMDLTKFISLLQTRSLFFCRLDKLEDEFEARLPQLSLNERNSFIDDIHSNIWVKENPNKHIEEDIKNNEDSDMRNKRINCVNCWNKYHSESYALWKIYSNQGIMILSNIDLLMESFNNTAENIYLSEIKYIDHNNDYFPHNNALLPVIHKHKAYSYEEEIRLIYNIGYDKKDLHYDWEKEKNKMGKLLKIDLNILIDKIILSPYSSRWNFDLIKDLLDKYELKKEIFLSDLIFNK